jgi:hypothetical protein
VFSHIRHAHTRYEELLKEAGYHPARHAVLKLVTETYIKWRGDEETGRDQQDAVLKEVVIISETDSEDFEDSESASDSEDESDTDDVIYVDDVEPDDSGKNLKQSRARSVQIPTTEPEAQVRHDISRLVMSHTRNFKREQSSIEVEECRSLSHHMSSKKRDESLIPIAQPTFSVSRSRINSIVGSPVIWQGQSSNPTHLHRNAHHSTLENRGGQVHSGHSRPLSVNADHHHIEVDYERLAHDDGPPRRLEPALRSMPGKPEPDQGRLAGHSRPILSGQVVSYDRGYHRAGLPFPSDTRMAGPVNNSDGPSLRHQAHSHNYSTFPETNDRARHALAPFGSREPASSSTPPPGRMDFARPSLQSQQIQIPPGSYSPGRTILIDTAGGDRRHSRQALGYQPNEGQMSLPVAQQMQRTDSYGQARRPVTFLEHRQSPSTTNNPSTSTVGQTNMPVGDMLNPGTTREDHFGREMPDMHTAARYLPPNFNTDSINRLTNGAGFIELSDRRGNLSTKRPRPDFGTDRIQGYDGTSRAADSPGGIFIRPVERITYRREVRNLQPISTPSRIERLIPETRGDVPGSQQTVADQQRNV